MGTVFNGKKWKGACVNGKKVSGLVKNGVLFFKSDNYTPPISEIYKRRIMVGDNLKGKKVYADFPNDYILELQDRLGTSFKTNTLINATNGLITEYTFPSMSGSGTEYYVASNFASDSSDNRFYWCSSSNTDNYVNNSEVLLENDKDYNTTQIDDTNPSYRHLFIEDPNIRPLQVGDVITANTKIYFTVPDDIDTVITDNSEVDRIIVLDDKSNYVSGIYISNQICMLALYVSYGTSTIFYEKQDGILDTNLSSAKDSRFVGTVKTINAESKIYTHVLVDTTTLG